MKKFLSLVLVFLLILNCGIAVAEMGVQIVGETPAEAEPVSLDNMQLNTEVEVPGWGSITLTSCRYLDSLFQYKPGMHTVAGNWEQFASGQEADYLVIQADIINTTAASRDYLSSVEVRAFFRDVEFVGWSWQYNWNNEVKTYDWNELNGVQNKEFVISRDDQFSIDPFYAGHYCFGCTLPNAVVSSEEPLKLVITIDGNEITYNVR